MSKNLALNGLIFALVAVVATVAIYGSGLSYGYIFDDLRLVDGTIVLSDPYSLRFGFRSLWVASYQWIHQTFGPDIGWQRGLNLLLHIVNVLALWWLTFRLIQRATEEDETLAPDWRLFDESRVRVLHLAIAAGVLLWSVNPVGTYAVAYLIQRSTLMATCFMALSLIAFIEGLRSGRWWWYGLTAAGYLLVLMSKEHAAPMIAILLPLYVFWKRPDRAVLIRAGVLLGAITIGAAVAVFGLKGWKLGAAVEDMGAPFLEQLGALSPSAKDEVYGLSVINQMWLFFRYGALWLLPWIGWLSIDIRVPFPLGYFSIQLVGALLYLSLLCASVWLLLARRGWLSLVGLVFLIPLTLFVTELAYVRLQEPFVLYRSYLWSVTIPALLALLFMAIIPARQWLVGVVVLIALGFGGMAFERVQSMRDQHSVWRDATEKMDLNAPANVLGRWRPPLNLSMALIERKNNEEALRYAKLSDQLGAPQGLAKFNQAAALSNLGVLDQAIAMYDAAERDGFTLRAQLYQDRGMALAKAGRFEEALTEFDRCLEETKQPNQQATVLLAAGRAANGAGQYDRAIKYYQRLAELQPELTAAPIGISYALYKKGDVEGAIRALNQSLAKRPSAEVLHARSFLFWQLGNQSRALADINVALAIAPGNPIYQAQQRRIMSGERPNSVAAPQ
jgi:Tfp pilus assembly protein PilF